MIRAALLLAAPLLLAGSRDDPLAGRVAGKPEQCLFVTQAMSPDIVDQHTILYRSTTSRRIWRTGPVGPCPSLRPLEILIIEHRSGTQLCRNDQFRVLTPGTAIPSAYCRFDAFVPYDPPPK